MSSGKKINVLVLCGGPSSERDVSLKTGAQVMKALPREKYAPQLAEITKEGKWLPGGDSQQKLPAKNPSRGLARYSKGAIDHPDIVFVAMHGKFGEDGKVQALLETLGVPYTGSGVLASALAMNKAKTIDVVRAHGITTARSLTVTASAWKKNPKTILTRIKKGVGIPCVVKPNESGSSIGVSIVNQENEIKNAVTGALKEDQKVFIEEYIQGKELTCAVLGNSGGKLTALPPIEIVSAGEFFDYKAKYFSKQTKEICPARISQPDTATVKELAKKAHSAVGCDGLTRSDFILTPRGEFYFLEINTIPGLTEASLAPKAALAHGMSFPEFLDRQIQLALRKQKKAP